MVILIPSQLGSPLVPGQPGPNMRAAAYQAQQQPQKGQGASSFIMPIYTLGIVAFFVFTIGKIVMKKVNKNKVQPMESDPVFVEKVFKQAETDPKKKLGEFTKWFALFWLHHQNFLIFQRFQFKFVIRMERSQRK